MKYNFDEIIDRTASNCVKLEQMKENFGREDLISLWIADMDFLSPPQITNALKERCNHGLFGYTAPSQNYFNSIISWLKRKHDYSVQQHEITFIPGVVKGFAFAIDVFTNESDKIIIQPPVYPPFQSVTESLHRQIVNNPLILKEGKFHIDFEGLRKIIAENDCKMLIFCNPHNPGGRIWSVEEQRLLAEICYENNILVVSDEIHADLSLPGYSHVPFAKVSEKARENSITLMAPSKTFNIAGIVSSFGIVHNNVLREKYFNYLEARELNRATVFAYTATEAAYNGCDDWLGQALEYISKNIEFVDQYLKQNIPQIKIVRPQASFLIWLDCRELKLSHAELVNLFVNKAKLALNDGSTFGLQGEGFMRLNVGVPRSVISQALNNLTKAIQS